MFFDTHVNLHGEAFLEDLPDVLSRAESAGISRMLAICDKLESVAAISKIADENDGIWRSVGVHPHYAKDHGMLSPEDLIDLASADGVVGIGETGLDLHYGYSPLSDQISCFEAHIKAAQVTGLPIIIHTRDADVQTAEILESAYRDHPFPILMHCYTGGPELARRAFELGAYFSVSGILSFKNAVDVRSVISDLPEDRVILETDCPYLAPVPKRGRRNEPAFLVHVAEAYAKLRGKDVHSIAAETTDNALRLFQRIKV